MTVVSAKNLGALLLAGLFGGLVSWVITTSQSSAVSPTSARVDELAALFAGLDDHRQLLESWEDGDAEKEKNLATSLLYDRVLFIYRGFEDCLSTLAPHQQANFENALEYLEQAFEGSGDQQSSMVLVSIRERMNC